MPRPVPPPLPAATKIFNPLTVPSPPAITANGPPGAFLLELLIYSGHPFKDHWAYWVGLPDQPDRGVLINAVGDVNTGFKHEIERGYDLSQAPCVPARRIPLQWVEGIYFDEQKLRNAVSSIDDKAVCGFEASALSVPAPQKSLNAAQDNSTIPEPIKQRNCQTWIVESAAKLHNDGILSAEVGSYVLAMQ